MRARNGVGEPIRLLAFGISWPPETFIQRKLTGLVKAGFAVTAAVKAASDPVEPFLPGVKVVPLAAMGVSTLAAVARSPLRSIAATRNAVRSGVGSFERRMRRLRNLAPLIGEDPHIVHFEWNSAAIDYLPFLHIWDAPVVISCRGTQVFVRPHVSPEYKKLLQRSFASADAVHCVCDAIQDEAVGMGLDPGKVTVIRPAVDTREFAPAPREASAMLHIVANGVLNWRKGYEYMLLTVRQVLDLDIPVRLSIVGKGEEAPRVRCAIEALGLDQHVALLDHHTPVEVRALLNSADVFLHSSLGEGISNAVLEAMACGLPVVTSDCGGMREAITDGHDGFVTPVRDPAAAAAAIARLARDATLRVAIGRNARATAESRFRLEDQIASFVGLYERLAAAGAS